MGNSSESAEQLLAPLTDWLALKILGAADVSLVDIVEPSQGLSNRTVLFRARWTQNGAPHERALVARIQRDAPNPALSDIFHQYQVMKTIAAHSNVMVPPLYLAESDASIIGAPFFLMDHVDGRVPSDFPSYHANGWFAKELSKAERETSWWYAIQELARLHKIGWEAFPFLRNGETQPPSTDFYLTNFIGNWYKWAAQDRIYPEIERAIKYLQENKPSAEHVSLVWNDARMGNTMFARNLSVAALVDFEVATLGPPEIDLAWWLYAEDIFSVQYGLERIAGIPDRETAIAGFEQIYGRSMSNFAYYEAIAALKHAVLSIRDYSNGKVMNKPREMLPNFAINRLTHYLEQHAKQ